jgi:hypothetical protein
VYYEEKGERTWRWEGVLRSYILLIPLWVVINHLLAELIEETRGMDVSKSFSSPEAFHWSGSMQRYPLSDTMSLLPDWSSSFFHFFFFGGSGA